MKDLVKFLLTDTDLMAYQLYSKYYLLSIKIRFILKRQEIVYLKQKIGKHLSPDAIKECNAYCVYK